MVNYNLGLCTKNTIEKVELLRILGEKTSKNLESIDELTTFFINEDELKTYLYSKGLINTASLNKELKIFYKNSGKNKRLPVMYCEHKKIMENLEMISKKIYEKESRYNMYTSDEKKYNNLKFEFDIFSKLIGNVNFLTDISRHYSIGNAKYNFQLINVRDINMFLSDVRSNGGHVFYPNYMYVAMYELFKTAMYNIEKNPSKNKVKFNYRGFRDLVNFIYKYKLEKNLINKENYNDMTEKITFEQKVAMLENDNNHYYDILNNEEIIYENGFPPNSEELRNYKKYLESLPEEYYNYDEHKKNMK